MILYRLVYKLLGIGCKLVVEGTSQNRQIYLDFRVIVSVGLRRKFVRFYMSYFEESYLSIERTVFFVFTTK